MLLLIYTVVTYNVIMAISAIVLALLAYSEEISKIRFFYLLKKLLFKFAITVVTILIGGWAALEKDKLTGQELSDELRLRDSTNEVKRGIVEKEHQTELRKRDSSMNSELRKRDSTKNDADLAYQLAAAKQQNRIVNLVKDSIDQEIPDFALGSTPTAVTFKYDSLTKDLIGSISLDNRGNCPVITTVFYNVVFRYKADYVPVNLTFLMFKDKRVAIKTGTDHPIVYHDISVLPGRIYIYVHGDYRSANKKGQAIPINDIVVYDFETQTWGSDLYSVNEKVKEVLRSAKLL